MSAGGDACEWRDGDGTLAGSGWAAAAGQGSLLVGVSLSASGRSIARPPQEPDMDRDMDRGSVVTGHEGFRDRGGRTRTGSLSIGTQPRAGNGNDGATDSHHILIQSVR